MTATEGRHVSARCEKCAEMEETVKRVAKRTRYAAEDLGADLTHTIKHYPLEAVGIAFGTGAAFGIMLNWLLIDHTNVPHSVPK